MSPRPISRRSMIAGTAAAAGGALLSKLPAPAEGQQATAAPAAAAPPVVGDPTKAPGAPTTAVGERSPFVQPKRAPVGDDHRHHAHAAPGSRRHDHAGRSPLRAHPRRHSDDRSGDAHAAHSWTCRSADDASASPTSSAFPPVTRDALHRVLRQRARRRTARRSPDMTPQQVDGMTSNSEWTGVPLSPAAPRSRRQERREVVSRRRRRRVPAGAQHSDRKGMRRRARRLGAERRAAASRAGIPDSSAAARLGGQHEREMAAPHQARHRAVHDALGDVEVHRSAPRRQSAAVQLRDGREVDHHVARVSRALSGAAGGRLRGLAWSGRGRITRVDVSTDGGATWQEAALRSPPMPKAQVRFRAHVAAGPAMRVSHEPRGRRNGLRAADDGASCARARGPGTDYHFNSHPRLARRARRRGDVRGEHVSRASRLARLRVARSPPARRLPRRAPSRDRTPEQLRRSAERRRRPRSRRSDVDVGPDGAGLPAGTRHAGAGRGDLRGEVRVLPRRRRRRASRRSTRSSSADRRGVVQLRERPEDPADDRQLLAVRDDGVRLRASRDAAR